MTVPTVVMVRKKTDRSTTRKASGKAPYKGRQPSYLPLTNELLIDAGYTYPEQCVDELLELAGDTGPQSRCELGNALQLAHLAYDDARERGSRQRPPTKQIEQL